MNIKSALNFGGLVIEIVVLLPMMITIVYADDQVYRWMDATGNPVYSSQQPDSSVKPADLPPIMREKVSDTPLHLRASCKTHGGISCESGSDADGSVICADGFKDASARFQLRCSVTKLSLTEASPLLKPDGSVTVWVRNDKDIVAKGVELSLAIPEGDQIKAQGPSEIQASELVEYTFKDIREGVNVNKDTIKLSCSNCG
jgi:hypothetical protein